MIDLTPSQLFAIIAVMSAWFVWAALLEDQRQRAWPDVNKAKK